MADVYTIGHSTRPLADLLTLLEAHGIEGLIDVRTMPRSRKNPQFNRENLPAPLAAAGIEYDHKKELGGLRHPRKDSTNLGWRNESFRGYADYMETPEFEAAIEWLIERAAARRVAIMCAEAVPWRCHRSLIADALVARGHRVEHIMTASRRDPHAVTSFAVIEGDSVQYPKDGQRSLF